MTIQLEKHLGRTGGPSWSFSNSTITKLTASVVPPSRPPLPSNNKALISTDPKCFKCGESGYRANECRKGDRVSKRLFVETKDISEETNVLEGDPQFDDGETKEEIVQGDHGVALVTYWVCFSPKEEEGDGWLCHNIFHSTCTVSGKICRLVIDLRNCKNLVVKEVVGKLKLETVQHPNPYNLSWL